jgi:SdrD B-like domain
MGNLGRSFSSAMKQAVLLSAASVAIGSMAFAETVSYSDNKPTDFTNWADTFQLTQFDPALGTLLSVTISMTGTNTTQTLVENRSGLANILRSGSDVTLNLSDSEGALLSLTSSVRFTNQLLRFDNLDDFAGTSGVSNPPRETVLTQSTTLVSGVDAGVASFIGQGLVTLDVTAAATGFYNGPAAASYEVITKAGAEVVVTYEYQPPQEDPLGELGDRVWHDLNSDGVQDLGEPGLVGWTVTLFDADTNTQLGSMQTGDDGKYLFPALPAGNYRVTVTPQPNWNQTYDYNGLATPHTATYSLAPGEKFYDLDYGYVLVPLGSLGDRVWHDLNSDGVQDANEVGLVGWTVTLFDVATGNQLGQQQTGDNGTYLFSDLDAGNYRVTVTPQPNWAQTFDLDGINTAHTATATLTRGQNRTDVDFGYVFCPPAVLGSIGDRVWKDLNANGIQESSEQGLVGWTVTLIRNGTVLSSQQTGANGIYLFNNLPAGTYTVQVTRRSGYTQTFDLDGLLTANVATATLGAGENRRDVDFGYTCFTACPPSGCGCTPGFWSNRGLGLVRPIDLAVLTSLKLVDGSGNDVNFMSTSTYNFGGSTASWSVARTRFSSFIGSQNAANMAAQLSRHLAAFQMNIRYGFIRSNQSFWFNGKCYTATQMVTIANNELCRDQFTPSGDPNRRVQETLKNILAKANECACR